MTDLANETPARGRPRDPTLEPRVFDAAIALYAVGGWQAFSFDAVAKAAGVGKAALYRRWSDPASLLYDTLEARWYPISAIDTGSLHDDLVALARLCLDTSTGALGGVSLHLNADSVRFEEVNNAARQFRAKLIHEGRLIVRRAIRRGELADHVSPGLVMDLVVGGVNNHVLSTPARLKPKMVATADEFIRELVGVVMRGVTGPST